MAHMPIPATVLALSLVASAQQPSAPGAAAQPPTIREAVSPQMSWDEPPPGSPEDRALFASAWKAQKEAIAEHSQAHRMLSDLSSLAYADRLYELAKAGGDKGKEATGLRERVRVAAEDVYRASRQPPFDLTHGCKPFLEPMQDVMAPGSPRKDELVYWRKAVSTCREKLTAWTVPLARANRAMEPLMAETQKLLGPPATMTFLPGAAPDVPAATRKD